MADPQYKDIVGQPISGMPDCYQVGPGDTGYPAGSTCKPQGDEGPVFRKEVRQHPNGQHVYVWVHIAGGVAPLFRKRDDGVEGSRFARSLRNFFRAPARGAAIQRNFGPAQIEYGQSPRLTRTPQERAAIIQNEFGVPEERSKAIERDFGPNKG